MRKSNVSNKLFQFSHFQYCIVVFFLLFGVLFNPVSAKINPNYKPQFLEDNKSSLLSQNAVNYYNLTLDKSIYTTAERKFSTDLLNLLSPEKDPRLTPEMNNNTIFTLKRKDLYKIPGETIYWDEKNGTEIKATTNMVYVTIGVTPGISTHILDSHLYLPINRLEDIIGLYSISYEGNSMNAWVEFSQLMNIANISSVKWISPIIYGSFGEGRANDFI